MADTAADAMPLASLAARCAEAEAHPRRLGEWVVLHHVPDRAREAGLEPFVDALAGEQADRALGLFRRRLWQLWADMHISLRTKAWRCAGSFG